MTLPMMGTRSYTSCSLICKRKLRPTLSKAVIQWLTFIGIVLGMGCWMTGAKKEASLVYESMKFLSIYAIADIFIFGIRIIMALGSYYLISPEEGDDVNMGEENENNNESADAENNNPEPQGDGGWFRRRNRAVGIMERQTRFGMLEELEEEEED